MSERVKFQVWSVKQWRWRTAYVKRELLEENIRLFRSYGFAVFAAGVTYGPIEQREAA